MKIGDMLNHFLSLNGDLIPSLITYLIFLN